MKFARTLGVLGGMGPMATNYFLTRLTGLTPADKDQDHLTVITLNNPKIPDRTLAYLGKGLSPASELVKSVRFLEKCDVELIAVPCNSAHLWFKEMQRACRVEILNMIDLVMSELSSANVAGLLAATVTVNSGLYSRPASQKCIRMITPVNQDSLMRAIYLIKQGKIAEARPVILSIINELIEDGATIIVSGCTEIALAIHQRDVRVGLIDPQEYLAKECIRRLGMTELTASSDRAAFSRARDPLTDYSAVVS